LEGRRRAKPPLLGRKKNVKASFGGKQKVVSCTQATGAT
jgi:hypothetical protein